MAGTITIPLTTLNNGVQIFGPANLAAGDNEAVLQVDRTVAGGLNSLTPSATLALTVEQSNDGGTTWFLIVGGIMIGGAVPAPKGGVGNATTSDVGSFFAPGVNRSTRAKITTSGGPIVIQGSLTIS